MIAKIIDEYQYQKLPVLQKAVGVTSQRVSLKPSDDPVHHSSAWSHVAAAWM